jgi:putative (di)nucleoside polyphosphate hydrolase
MESGGKRIPGVWDFPKGGVSAEDSNLQTALVRELQEETGSSQYRIVHEFTEKIVFVFPENHGSRYTEQETSMFLVEYCGDGTDLQPQDEEIDAVAFFPPEEIFERVPFPESKTFFAAHRKKIIFE